MCDYCRVLRRSVLSKRKFGTGTRGFAASEDANVAVCIPPGIELSFSSDVIVLASRSIGLAREAIFRQIKKEKVAAHHDALEFPDGQVVLLTSLCEEQQATVLQLPARQRLPLRLRLSGGQPSRNDCSQYSLKRWPLRSWGGHS
jgi:hypothetical protein